MSRIAFFSELHGNLDALEAVLGEIRGQEDIRQLYCLGDFVGYGPSPNEVVERVQALPDQGYSLRCNIGNHDAAAIGRYEFVDLHDPAELERVCKAGGFPGQKDILKAYRNPETRKYVPVKPDAHRAMVWTIQQLREGTRSFLETRLESRIEVMPGVITVHASPRDMIFEYVRNGEIAQKCLESQEMNGVQICFHGHTHVPVTWVLPAEERMSYGDSVIVMTEPKPTYREKVELDLAGKLYLVNVGSVGQPRGQDLRACYVIYDTEASLIEFRRVAYDSAPTRAKILAAGLPDALAGRLGGEDTDA
ncbi:MAG: metallophosphatase family protein [Planctomycetes bacterium]|nr:metallophosphatase family protein [Planctomycetota bacterium]